MSEDKNTVEEKRVSKGIIRRRARSEEEEAKQEKPASVAAPAKPEVVSVPSVSAPSSKPIVVSKTVSTKPVETKVESAPEQPVRRTLRVVGELPPRPVTPKVISAPIHESEMPQGVKPPPRAAGAEAKPGVQSEEARPLSFKDRIKGTISLDKFKPAKPTVAGETPEVSQEVKEGDEESESKTNVKVARVRKGPKTIGGDLDIDGLGREANLTHLVRTVHVDRIFRPGATTGTTGPKRKKIISKKAIKSTIITQKGAHKCVVEVDQKISVGNLALAMDKKAGDVIKSLMKMGEMVTINHELDFDTATLIAQEFGYTVKNVSFDENALLQESLPTDQEKVEEEGAVLRPPVVTIMGHVDHGKTSLLDAIRSTNVTAGEAGGITQHIGAYTVELPQGKITFLDTPGHEAFTAIRARGSQVTDIVILVVAADDGVMPQTLESIDHARAAGVPIIVAVNKMDKEGANPERVTRQLSERGLLSEAWGGDTLFVPVSAVQKTGIKELLESILLQAEIMELKANPNKRAVGVVIEAKLDRFRGPVCTVLIQEGTIKTGDDLVSGGIVGRVRSMVDWKGDVVKEAGPSIAVEILGMESVPEAGDKINVVASDQDARQIAENRKLQQQANAQTQRPKSLEEMFAGAAPGMKELSIILKTDVQGSLEAVRDSLLKLSTDDVKTKIVSSGVGGITESDVVLAVASNAVVIGFNVRPETKAIHSAKEKGVDIKLYRIIYELLDEVKLAMAGLLEPTRKETYLGRAEVKQVFTVSKVGQVAGCLVSDGTILRSANIRLLRNNAVIHEGKIGTLKRFKDDAREVKKGLECGIGFESYQDIKEGDVLEAFTVEMIQRTL